MLLGFILLSYQSFIYLALCCYECLVPVLYNVCINWQLKHDMRPPCLSLINDGVDNIFVLIILPHRSIAQCSGIRLRLCGY